VSAERSQLKGIVACFLATGKPVDAANDTRYEMFGGGWMEAADVTQRLAERGLVSAPESGDHGEIDVNHVTPTAKGIFEAIS
jgi:hypothetical protein